MTQASNPDIEKIAKPGDIVAGKYLVDRVLGVGGMGAVVAATHTQLDQRVAIKFLLPQMLGSREVVERFQREARAAAKIRSEHVVRVSDVGTLDGGVPFIVMEFLEGKDLGELLQRRGPLPVPLAVDYVLEACEALAEAHAAGIVHRDLKPSNLFLARRADETDIVKVLDFGISKQITPEALQSSPSLTRTTDVFGSPTYMSPEQLKASRDVDTRADLWALGVILFELISGAPPSAAAPSPRSSAPSSTSPLRASARLEKTSPSPSSASSSAVWRRRRTPAIGTSPSSPRPSSPSAATPPASPALGSAVSSAPPSPAPARASPTSTLPAAPPQSRPAPTRPPTSPLPTPTSPLPAARLPLRGAMSSPPPGPPPRVESPSSPSPSSSPRAPASSSLEASAPPPAPPRPPPESPPRQAMSPRAPPPRPPS
ncbi:MAG: serine/threonine-protein kinase [Polyangiaceae bacterium]